MSEWWTYRPSDFLLFAPRTYYRLFELYNSDIWPVHVVALLAGVTILVLMRSHAPWRGRADRGHARGMLAVGRMGFPLAALCNDQLGGELFCGRLCDRGATVVLDWSRSRPVALRFQPQCESRASALRCSSLH